MSIPFLKNLQSIKTIKKPNANILIAVIINSGIDDNKNILLQNRLTFTEVERFAVLNNESNLIYFPLLCENLPRKHAGVGLARKIGMDLAIDHFHSNNILYILNCQDYNKARKRNGGLRHDKRI